MRGFLNSLFLLTILTGCTGPEVERTDKSDSVTTSPLSATGLTIDQDLSSQLNGFLADARRKLNVPGASAVVINGANRAWVGADGYKSLTLKTPLRPDSMATMR